VAKPFLNIARCQAITLILALALIDNINAATPESIDQGSAMQIKVERTRPVLTVGAGFGVIAEIKNISKSAIYFHAKQVTLVVPPELLGDTSVTAWYGFFPTEIARFITETKGPDGETKRVEGDWYEATLGLQPGDSYKIFWFTKTQGEDVVSSSPENPSQASEEREKRKLPGRLYNFAKKILDVIYSELNFVFFSPGEYKLTVVAKYWTDPKRPENRYRTAVETVNLLSRRPSL